MGGFFQYSNTFALFLLLGIVVLAFEQHALWQRLIGIAVLLFGIFATGSRTVFFLLLIVIVVVCIRQKQLRWPLLGIAGVLTAASILFVVITGNVQTLGRFLTTSLSSSTLLGRLLYYWDALPVILRHPFGLGYLGYYYLQPSFQTGAYIVKFIHNDYLQMLLDIGWIPAAAFFVALVRGFFSKRIGFQQRLLLVVISAHILLDFDLQFLSVFFVLLMTLDSEAEKEKQFLIKPTIKHILCGASGLLAIVCVYFGCALFVAYRGDDRTAVELYPQYTASQTVLLAKASSAQEAERIADEILAHNEQIPLAYDAKALASASHGDYPKMMEYKQKSISIARYTLAEYIDYFNLLRRAMENCIRQGDLQQAEVYRTAIKKLPAILKSVAEQSSPLAWKLSDKPELTLPERFMDYIDRL